MADSDTNLTDKVIISLSLPTLSITTLNTASPSTTEYSVSLNLAIATEQITNNCV